MHSVCMYIIVDLLESVKAIHGKDKANPKLVTLRPSILRSLFTVGLFCKHFNIDAIVQTSSKVCVAHTHARTYTHAHILFFIGTFFG